MDLRLVRVLPFVCFQAISLAATCLRHKEHEEHEEFYTTAVVSFVIFVHLLLNVYPFV